MYARDTTVYRHADHGDASGIKQAHKIGVAIDGGIASVHSGPD
jgi:hypothetical protein